MNGISLADLIASLSTNRGINPFGLRHGTGMPKGMGYMGMLPEKGGGVSTEISAEQDGMEYPLIVPSLSKKELNLLLSGKKPTEDIYMKAIQWAESRKKMGLNPFATPQDIRMPAGLLD